MISGCSVSTTDLKKKKKLVKTTDEKDKKSKGTKLIEKVLIDKPGVGQVILSKKYSLF